MKTLTQKVIYLGVEKILDDYCLSLPYKLPQETEKLLPFDKWYDNVILDKRAMFEFKMTLGVLHLNNDSIKLFLEPYYKVLWYKIACGEDSGC